VTGIGEGFAVLLKLSIAAGIALATLKGLWIASCFLTPGADPYSPLIVGVSFTVLYFVSEALIRLIGK
jgi:hypothetical protein